MILTLIRLFFGLLIFDLIRPYLLRVIQIIAWPGIRFLSLLTRAKSVRNGRLIVETGLIAWIRDFTILAFYGPLTLFADINDRYPGNEPVTFYFPKRKCVLLRHAADVQGVFNSPKMSIRGLDVQVARFTSLLGRNIITVPVSIWKTTRQRTMAFLSGEYLKQYQIAMTETAEQFLIPVWERHAKSGEPLNVWNSMLGYSSLVVFMAFMGLKKDEIPRDIYLSLNKMFVHVRSYIQAAFPIPLWIPTIDNLLYQWRWRKLSSFVDLYIEAQKDSSTMLGSITRTYTTRQWKDFDHLLVFLQSMVADGGKIVADDEIRIYFEQHQRDALWESTSMIIAEEGRLSSHLSICLIDSRWIWESTVLPRLCLPNLRTSPSTATAESCKPR